MQLTATIVVVGLAIFLLVRNVDVRLVLFGAGLALASLALRPLVVFDVFLFEMGNGKTIGPICSAMGYAFVLRATGCDRAMVRLLLAPVSRARWLLIPAGCLVGFVTNVAVTSQTATAAAVGPILVPLMLAAGYSPVVAAATLVLGCSGGGSLYNPGDADLVAIHEASQAPMKQVLDAIFLPLLAGFVTTVAAFALVSGRGSAAGEPVTAAAGMEATAPPERWKALLPPLPVILIFAMMPGVFFASLPPPFEKGLPVSHAMIFSTAVLLILTRRDVSAQVKAFFEGMGYAFVHVISLIITASCFIAGMTEVGLTDRLVRLVSGAGWTSKVAAGLFPGLLAVISGSGIGPSVAFSKAVLPTVSAGNLPAALDLGVLSAIASTFGRTMSPVAAVVIFCGAFAGVPPLRLVKTTALPLIAGFAVTLVVVFVRAGIRP
ncbi:MAG: hypothetical protein JWM88_1044 [Verrucomicrobia bacterium]|nr:hypothetical protein [Verrucomicrobiota bacterium]